MTALTTTSQPTVAQFYLAQEEHARDLAELNRLREVNAELVEALGLIASMYEPDGSQSVGSLARSMYEARCIAVAALAKAEAK